MKYVGMYVHRYQYQYVELQAGAPVCVLWCLKVATPNSKTHKSQQVQQLQHPTATPILLHLIQDCDWSGLMIHTCYPWHGDSLRVFKKGISTFELFKLGKENLETACLVIMI